MTTETPTIPTPAESAPRSLYKYSAWIHVGHGAGDCSEVDEEAGIVRCGDTAHFHAWCRVPNPLQEEEIRERALAAKARRIRQVRSQGTDANEILEVELETLQAEPDSKERMAKEVAGSDWASDYMAAVDLVRNLDDEEDESETPAKLFAHIDDDKGRYGALSATPEAERNQDEYLELQSHLADYETRCSTHFEAIQAPKRESYMAMDDLDLVNLTRRKRVDRIGHDEFMRAYAAHEWLSCSFTQKANGKPCFTDMDQIKNADPEVLTALQVIFADLEMTAQAAAGN